MALNFDREPNRRGGCVVCGKATNGVSVGTQVTKRHNKTKKTTTVASNWNPVCEVHAEAVFMGIEESSLKVIRQQKLSID